jgi:acetolactate synthase-1/2/3 large subunit
MIKVSDYIVRKLEDCGVSIAFMLSGGMMMHLMNSVGRSSKIRYFCNHHEQASAMAADCASRILRKPSLCLATSGPGATNVLTGLVGAWQDSTPVIFLTGQSKVSETIRGNPGLQLRQAGFLDVDIIPIVQSVTKYCAFLQSAEEVRFHTEKAIHEALTGRPGPVLLDCPLDIQGALFDPDGTQGFEIKSPVSSATNSITREVRLALDKATKPLLYLGNGVGISLSREEVKSCIETIGVPVVTTPIAKDIIPYEHPLFSGHPGIRGNRAANILIQECDLLLIAGVSLKPQNIGYEWKSFANQAHKIHVDIDPNVLQHGSRFTNRAFQCDTGAFLLALAQEISTTKDVYPRWPLTSPWQQQALSLKTNLSSRNEPHVLGQATDRCNAYEVIDLINELLSEDAVVITDAGQPFYILGQALNIRGSQRYIVPGSLAEMGYAIPAAIGAAIASPKSQIVVITGDGSFHTNVQELETIRNYNLPVKIIIIDNDGYASIRSTQDRFFGGFRVGSCVSSGVSLPDPSDVARTYGFQFTSCKSRNELRSTLEVTLRSDGPFISSISCLPTQPIIPAVPSKQLPDGTMVSAPLNEMLPGIGQ